jgi:trans-L-3-hydroxyproline dehydratase
MTAVPTETRNPVHEHVVRHYRGAERPDVERAYRSDALQAARAGYVPMSHAWTQDRHGLLLAVTYGSDGAVSTAAPSTSAAAAPASAEARVPPRGGDMRVPQPEAVAEAVAQFTTEPIAQQLAAEPIARQRPAYKAVQRISAIDGRQPESLAPNVPSASLPGASVPDHDFARAQPSSATDRFEAVQAHGQGARDEFAPAPEFAGRAFADSLDREALPRRPGQSEPPAERYTPPPGWYAAPDEMYVAHEARYTRGARLTVQTMDLHTAGEPLRLIRSGYPDVPMLPVLERRRWVKENADHVRRALMFEPRGHTDMYGAILLPPYNDYADVTVLFMHNEGYSTMCGHGIIAITTGLIEEGLFPATEPLTTIRYEVPAGIVVANAATVKLEDGTWAVHGVRFTNVPSYLAAGSLSVRPDGVQLRGTAAQYGALRVDVAFGGAYYGIVNAAELGLRVVPEQAAELRRVGAAITSVLRRDHTPAHPTDAALSFVYGTIIVDFDPRTSPDGKAADAHMRNATIFAEAELDRSPCGSGTSAILAQLHARGRLGVGQQIVNAGITGEHFLGRVEGETTLGPYAAVSTSIAGTAYVTGYSTFIVDSRDPLGDGFLLS